MQNADWTHGLVDSQTHTGNALFLVDMEHIIIT